MMEQLNAWMEMHPALFQVTAIAVLLAACYVLNLILRHGVIPAIQKLTRRTRTSWDDAMDEAKVFARLAQMPPAFLAYQGIALIPEWSPALSIGVRRAALAWMVLAAALAGGGMLSAVNVIYSRRPEHRDRPIKGYVQVVKIVLYVATGIVILGMLMDRSPWILLSGLGAMTAVLLLVFKDTVLSLVASIQLTGNKMIRVGDWISMPQLGADGDVIDVALHTVKVQNWDKTITTFPTHKLISESFKNWRGMSESGGRRIKRALYIDVNSIRFLTEEEIERFGQFALLKDYIAGKRKELAEHNRQQALDQSISADLRRLTNMGTLRHYIVQYLRTHPKIHQEMTLLVRQRDPTPEGLPLEIYAFTNDTAWAAYEDIQSDIFDHILALVPEFGLRIFQKPSGLDLEHLGTTGS